jgi:hypothetical protein
VVGRAHADLLVRAIALGAAFAASRGSSSGVESAAFNSLLGFVYAITSLVCNQQQHDFERAIWKYTGDAAPAAAHLDDMLANVANLAAQVWW